MTLPRRTFLHLAAGTAALPIASPVAVLGQGTMTPPGAVRIVERTQYYAKPGLAAEVLDVRRKASAVRVSIGLPAGEIFVKHPGGDGWRQRAGCRLAMPLCRPGRTRCGPRGARRKRGIRERSRADEKTVCALRAASLYHRVPLIADRHAASDRMSGRCAAQANARRLSSSGRQ